MGPQRKGRCGVILLHTIKEGEVITYKKRRHHDDASFFLRV